MSSDSSVKKTSPKGVILLLLTALIWGSSFVAQSVGMEKIGAFTFNGIRTLLGAAVLLPYIIIKDRADARKMTEEELKEKQEKKKRTRLVGIPVSLVFFIAANLQQLAFYYSTAGKIAFVTSLYMFFVPIIGLFIGKKVPLLTWICVVMGFAGLYFLCIDPKDIGNINKGDLLALACAFFFAVHIRLIERYAGETDGVRLSAMQFLVAGSLTCIFMFIFEKPEPHDIFAARVPILYAGIMSCGLAYTFQIAGQKYTEATIASLLLCMESVFAVLAAGIILYESLSGREIIGCVIMFAAVILSQLSELSLFNHGNTEGPRSEADRNDG